MIIDLKKFLATERPYWRELETLLDRLEKTGARLDLPAVRRLHYLYQRASSDLVRLRTFAAQQDVSRHLEALVARSYAEIHNQPDRSAGRLSIRRWLGQTFPVTFRRHWGAFSAALTIMLAGCLFGAAALNFDADAKPVLMPFPQLLQDPADRVAQEESPDGNAHLEGGKTSFSSFLMTHNTKISLLTLALGITWGIGTVVLLFSNGVMLGAVAMDYVRAGQTTFLLGWLMPHGVIEIPAILLAGQTGLVLAGALIGWGRPVSLRDRLRQVSGDLVTLIFGVALMLVWAGIIEAFLSQYHEPVIPYAAKIFFGVIELVILSVYLSRSGRNRTPPPISAQNRPRPGGMQ